MYKTCIALRLTHKYVGEYAHRDEWLPLEGYPKVSPARETDEGNGMDDGGAYIRWVKLPGQLSRKNRDKMVRALEDSLSKHGCACEHDCCGCASYDTRVISRKGRHVVLRTTVGYNY
jgi:hypothetical protein